MVPPEDGWKPQTWYLVEVSYRPSNPMHKALFFTGFLDEDGLPAGYSGVTPMNYAPTEPADNWRSIHYLRALHPILNINELEG